LTENAGRENDGPSKLQDMKLTDQCAGREIAGHENARHEHDGPEMMARREIAGEKSSFNRDKHYNE